MSYSKSNSLLVVSLIKDVILHLLPWKLLSELHPYMKTNKASERPLNNTLKVMIAYTRYLGPDIRFFQINSKEQITNFLDTKIKPIITKHS
jgi:hypothetical protein